VAAGSTAPEGIGRVDCLFLLIVVDTEEEVFQFRIL
jgi:hypothetical protein